MATAKKTAATTKTAEEKAAEKEQRAQERKAATSGESTAPIATLPKGKGTQNDEPPSSNPPPIERGKGDRDAKEPRGEDTLRQNTDKARWNYGVSTDDTAELLREQREIDAANK